uniref:Uncharacterized protein n=1 Tax=Glossina brevipalpis TaxID=37001 RepID=A0A1A9WXU1_9MUSC
MLTHEHKKFIRIQTDILVLVQSFLTYYPVFLMQQPPKRLLSQFYCNVLTLPFKGYSLLPKCEISPVLETLVYPFKAKTGRTQLCSFYWSANLFTYVSIICHISITKFMLALLDVILQQTIKADLCP